MPDRHPSDLNIGRLAPPAKDNLDNIPATKPPPVELNRKDLKWHKGKPQVVDHFSAPQYAQYRYFGPTITETLDLCNDADLRRLDALHKRAHAGAESKGPAIILFTTRQVVGNRWICLAEYQDVFYREVIPPAAIHEPQSIPKKVRHKHRASNETAGGVP